VVRRCQALRPKAYRPTQDLAASCRTPDSRAAPCLFV
jgi:hypothetical protein